MSAIELQDYFVRGNIQCIKGQSYHHINYVLEVCRNCNRTIDEIGVEMRLETKDVEVLNSDPDLVLINNSLESNNPNHRDIAKIGLEMIALLIRKNIDYGSSVFDSPILCPDLPPMLGILVRLSDKINRLVQLSQNGNLVQSESFDDTINDLVGYGILYLILRRRDESKI